MESDEANCYLNPIDLLRNGSLVEGFVRFFAEARPIHRGSRRWLTHVYKVIRETGEATVDVPAIYLVDVCTNNADLSRFRHFNKQVKAVFKGVVQRSPKASSYRVPLAATKVGDCSSRR
jgi:hypothetical protein